MGEIGKGLQESWVAVIVVVMVINNEMTDVGHVFQELDYARIEAIFGRKVLLVLGMEEKRPDMKSEVGCIFQTTL